MRVPDHVIAHQLVRLSRLTNWPTDETLLLEIDKALRDTSANPEHCGQIADAWIRKSKWAPFPSDIYETAEANPYRVIVSGKDRRCVCGGTGFEQVWQLVTYSTVGGGCHKSIDIVTDPDEAERLRLAVDGKGQILYSAVRRCTHCEYGRGLKAVEEAA